MEVAVTDSDTKGTRPQASVQPRRAGISQCSGRTIFTAALNIDSVSYEANGFLDGR